MTITTKKNMGKKIFQKKSVVTGFCSLLLIGFLVASGFYWQGLPTASALVTESGKSGSAADMPGSFADLTEMLSPAVVNIKATKIEKVRDFHRPNVPEGPFGDFFEHFFRQMPQSPGNRPRQGAGSGVIISDDGYILTNNHVVEGATELTVTMNNKKEYKAKIVGRDPKTDLALLKIDAGETLPSATLGDSEELRVGDWVLAIGNPFGLKHTVTSGIVSAKGRIIGAGPYDDFIQTDASINPGNSGGPLFNMEGKVVGINTAIIPQGQGIGFAIPVNTAKPLIPQLIEDGEVTRGYLGVSIQTITPDLANALKIEEQKGALVSDVVPDGPAENAGIKRGDLIVAYNNRKVEDSHDLPQLVAETAEGQKATVTLIRNGKKKDIRVKVGRLPSDETVLSESHHSEQGKWGFALEDMDRRTAERLGRKDDRGVVVVDVQPGSPAALAGIRRGDIILEVNQEPVDSVRDVKKRIAGSDDKDSLLLLVNRNQGSFFVGLKG
jgi:serine protease Do